MTTILVEQAREWQVVLEAAEKVMYPRAGYYINQLVCRERMDLPAHVAPNLMQLTATV